MTRAKATDLSLINLEALLDRIEIDENGCWLWTAALNVGGYGRYRVGGQSWSAHRVMYEVLVGPVTADLHLDHLCRVRRCVNPDHLEPVTPRENLLRGDTLPAQQIARTHCAHGHPFSPENTHIRPSGRRTCRRCDSLRKVRVS